MAALTPPDEERTCCVRAPTGVPPCGYIRNRQGDHFVWRTRGDRTLVDTWIVSAVGDLLSKGHMAPAGYRQAIVYDLMAGWGWGREITPIP
ncbi:hypothetical protein [Nocardiopsis composta]|uniref:Uncharacterized protein n=1 Tax=Nocardiopsis composta TaxID=157465 RepID=A0A7W8VCR1_9ACTN|nr:hypothetical protein [Nocardiopsis composta]MBB5431245.1 hypothetical protein [Nocardiopsis composta]